MSLIPSRKLTEKQYKTLLLLFKLRSANVIQITLIHRPELDAFSNSNTEKNFSAAIRNTRHLFDALVKKGLIRVAKYGPIIENRLESSYYELTTVGLDYLYACLGLGEHNRFLHSGFGFDLGYFPTFTSSFSAHSNFQRSIFVLLTWIDNRHRKGEILQTIVDAKKYLAERDNEHTFFFSKAEAATLGRESSSPLVLEYDNRFKYSNICSWRDSLYSSERPNEVQEINKKKFSYRPDGEIKLVSDVTGRSKFNNTHREDRYFLEIDFLTERSQTIKDKMMRLSRRLRHYQSLAEDERATGIPLSIDLYRGVIFVIPDLSTLPGNRHGTAARRRERFITFFQAFRANLSSRLSNFSVIMTTPQSLENTIKSLRLEYYYDFGVRLGKALKHSSFNDVFNSKIYYETKLAYCCRTQVESSEERQVIYLFYGIEGYNSQRWYDFISYYRATKTRFNELKKQHGIGGVIEIYPIAVFMQDFAVQPFTYADTFDESLKLSDDEQEFYGKLHILSIQTAVPKFYFFDTPIDYLPHQEDIAR